VPEDEALLDLGRPGVEQPHVRDAPGAHPEPSLGPPHHPTGPQMHRQLPRQTGLGLHEQGRVDGLVGDPNPRVVGEVQPQAGRDLLGRPPLLEAILDALPKRFLRGQLPRPRTPGPGVGHPVGSVGPVAGGGGVAVDLPGHRGDRSPQPGSDRGERLLLGRASGDLLPLGEGEPQCRAGRPWTGPDPAGVLQPVVPCRPRDSGGPGGLPQGRACRSSRPEPAAHFRRLRMPTHLTSSLDWRSGSSTLR
jgi:hypothetical protein